MDLPDPAHRLARRAAFGSVAETYAAGRPAYPEALFAAVEREVGLSPGARVLEVAPGPGQATVSLLDRGWRVHGVELSRELAEHARQRLAEAAGQGRLVLDVGPFESWPPPPEPFDLVFCATAWHWLDPAVRADRAAAALRPGGGLAVVWTHVVSRRAASTGDDSFDELAAPLFRRWDPRGEPFRGLPDEQALPPLTGELEAAAAFTGVTSRRFPCEVTYTAREVAALHATYSAVLRLPRERREGLTAGLAGLVDDHLGGSMVRRYCFELVLALRV